MSGTKARARSRYAPTPLATARLETMQRLADFDREHPGATYEERKPYLDADAAAYKAMAHDDWIRAGCPTTDEILADLA